MGGHQPVPRQLATMAPKPIIPSARISDTSAPTVPPVMASAGRSRQTMKGPCRRVKTYAAWYKLVATVSGNNATVSAGADDQSVTLSGSGAIDFAGSGSSNVVVTGANATLLGGTG